MMAAIKGGNTAPEVAVRRAFHAAGLRFRLHDRKLPGRPDIVLPKYRAVVFVHGCFWHRHRGCRLTTTPSTNVDFWQTKFAANVERDIRQQKLLRKERWRVFVVWECQVESLARLAGIVSRIKADRPASRREE